MRLSRHPPRPAWVLALGALVLAVAACGVEVPDEVAARATTTTATTAGPSPSTSPPTSDDELEQALIDNGYSVEEARCGAERLREELDDDEVREIVEAASVEDIAPRVAARFAEALRGCVEGGPDDGPDGDDEDEEDDDEDDDDGGGRRGGPRQPPMPGTGDGSIGDVSRTRFLSALLAAGVPDDEARCLVDGIYAAFDQATINDIFQAPSPDALPDDVAAEVQAIAVDCR